MENQDLVFNHIFKISTKYLRYNYSHPDMARNRIWTLVVVSQRILAFLCFTALLYSIFFHDIKMNNYTEAIKNGIMAIVAVTVTFKHSILINNRETIIKLIDFLNEDYKTAMNYSIKEKKIIKKYTSKGVNMCKFWLISAGLTSFMFPIKAFILMAYHCFQGECQFIQMFDLTWPAFINERKDEPIIFCGIFAVCFLFDIFSMSVYIGFDPLVPIFLCHICGQLDLLGMNIANIFSTNDIEETKKKLKLVNIKLDQIYRFVNSVQEVFIILYEFNMKTTTFLIPFSAFQAVEALRQGQVSLEFIFFFFGALLHFFMPCYYSNLLMEKNKELSHCIYSCGWELKPNVEIRKTILVMLTRTSVPLVIRTVFYPICLYTFAEMARQAYGIYNIMNAAWG